MLRQYTNLRSARETADAVEQILAIGPDAPRVKYVTSVRLAPGHWEVARAVGQARKALKDLRGRQPGEARDSDVETDAALAELITSLLLDSSEARLAPLVSHKPDPALDVTIRGVSFDVKAIRAGAKCTAINADAHSKKTPRFYLFARPAGLDTLDFFVVGARAVDDWPLRKAYRGVEMPPRRWYRATDLPDCLAA